jgi:cytochrome c-type biogenesis protein CcmE
MFKIIATVLAVAGAGGVLLYSSFKDAEYYKFAHELMADPGPWEGKTLRVHGYVEPGSIDEKIVGQQTKRTFILESKGTRLLVKNDGPKPDTFRDEAEVVAKGRLINENGTYVFEAHELMAKCPSKYEENRRTGESPAEAVGIN